MGKSCFQQKKICLGEQYYGMTHPTEHAVQSNAVGESCIILLNNSINSE